jgi:cobalt/nickel transport system permease protein
VHIPDGYLSPHTYIPLYGASALCWSVALRKARRTVSSKEVPYLAMAAVFSFLIMMFNIPVPGGTTGHAVGSGIIACLLGPWTAVIAVSVVVIIQALVFGDGGITAIGANCFNMAIAMPFVSYWTFRLVGGRSVKSFRLCGAAFLSGYVGLTVSAVLAGIEFGIQPLIAQGADGRPLYAPYPLSMALPAMLAGHLFLFSVVEGVITLFLFRYFLKEDPALLHVLSNKEQRQ